MPKAVSSSHPVAFPTSMAFCTAAISPVTPATNSFIIKRLWLGVPYHTISTGAAFTALSTAAIPLLPERLLPRRKLCPPACRKSHEELLRPGRHMGLHMSNFVNINALGPVINITQRLLHHFPGIRNGLRAENKKAALSALPSGVNGHLKSKQFRIALFHRIINGNGLSYRAVREERIPKARYSPGISKITRINSLTLPITSPIDERPLFLQTAPPPNPFISHLHIFSPAVCPEFVVFLFMHIIIFATFSLYPTKTDASIHILYVGITNTCACLPFIFFF